MAGLPQLSMGAARRLELLQSRLVSILPGRIQVYRQRFDGLQQRLKAVLPHLLEAGKQRHRFATAQLAALAPRMTQVAHERLARAQSMLSALGPKNVLERGYAIIRRENGQVVRRQEDVATGENVEAMLASGKLRLVVSTDSENE
jgi:exodeoxyribonuclease VII large subunit